LGEEGQPDGGERHQAEEGHSSSVVALSNDGRGQGGYPRWGALSTPQKSRLRGISPGLAESLEWR
jgi:hypothetical protein